MKQEQGSIKKIADRAPERQENNEWIESDPTNEFIDGRG